MRQRKPAKQVITGEATRAQIILPYPPSVNHYWVHTGRGVRVSDAGKSFRLAVSMTVNAMRRDGLAPPHAIGGRLAVEVFVYPPDNRQRDLDNVLKATLDALGSSDGACRVYGDDAQIDRLVVTRCAVASPGRLVVLIERLTAMGFW